MTENEFSKIDPSTLPPELQQLYKEMQADYTRKAQEVAEQRKGFDTERQRYEETLQQYGGMKQEIEQWRQWYSALEAEANRDGQSNPDTSTDDFTSDTTDAATMSKIAKLEQTIEGLKGQLENVNSTVATTTDRTGRMFAFHAQLADLQREHPDLDRDKLLAHATEKKITDLKQAYEDLYRDDIINVEVEKRLADRLKEERAKIFVGSGRQVVIKPSDGAKSFDEATQQILDERAADGSLDLGGY